MKFYNLKHISCGSDVDVIIQEAIDDNTNDIYREYHVCCRCGPIEYSEVDLVWLEEPQELQVEES